MRIAILDDYLGAALGAADWTGLAGCEVVVFNRPLRGVEEAGEALAGFDVLCLMRERTAITRELLFRLPRVRFIASTGVENRSIDMTACIERGVLVSHTLPSNTGLHATAELTWGLILAAARDLCEQHASMRAGGWQSRSGFVLHGKTLGLLGLGRIGAKVASIAPAFGMNVIAWSPNLTEEGAARHGARRVQRAELFAESDILSIHLVSSPLTRGLVARDELRCMRTTSVLVNTSRAAIVDEPVLLEALRDGWIAGAALDVYEEEPPGPENPLRQARNATLSPHLGFVARETLREYYSQSVENIAAFLGGSPIRLVMAAPGKLDALAQE